MMNWICKGRAYQQPVRGGGDGRVDVAAAVLPTRSTVRFWTASVDGSDNQMDMGLEPWRLRVVDDDDPDPRLDKSC